MIIKSKFKRATSGIKKTRIAPALLLQDEKSLSELGLSVCSKFTAGVVFHE